MKCKKIGNHDLDVPRMESMGAAGYDLRAAESITLYPGQRKLVPTGWAIQIPEGMCGLVRPRSGHAVKHGLHVMAGLIDSDFRGELKVLLVNLGERPETYLYGDRVAQLVVVPIYQTAMREVEELEKTERGAGAFGSTGRA